MADQLGYLNVCMDRRFWLSATQLFEKETGLLPGSYWLETNPGGANTKQETVGEDFAASKGAILFGWGAHGSHCGGQPEVSDEESRQRLEQVIEAKKKKYPDARHYGLFFTDEKVEIWEA